MQSTTVNASQLARVDGPGKLAGTTLYVDDLRVAGVLHGGTVRSPVPRGRIRQIRFDPAVNWDEYTIVDHRDIPGPNVVKLIEQDQPALADGHIRHKHEPVVLLAHRSLHKLRQGLRGITIEVAPLPAILDPLETPTPETIQFGTDNVFKRIDIRKGDPAPVFAQAAHVIEGTYRTGAQEHMYLEAQAVLAVPEEGRLAIFGSVQCPFYVLDALVHLFNRPAAAFRVVQMAVGGGFGGKEEYPSILAIHAALLSQKSGAPVKIVYDRAEDMAVTTKRHPSVVRHRTALDKDGRLLAMEVDVVLDGGAYVTLSPVVLSRGTIHAAGPYHCDNIHIHGEARFTNSPPYGAFRGFGAPQTFFALERHMDVIARRIGLSPDELRRRNLLRPGQTTATSQVFRETTDLVALLDRALELGQYHQRRTQHAEFNQSHPYLRRGVGLATFHHGAGFTGAGEAYLASEVSVEAAPDGTVEVLTAQTDMGQGTNTIMTQVAAEALQIPADQVRIAQPDTSRVPNSGPTVASRTAMVVGNLVAKACADLTTRANAEGKGGTQLQDAIRQWYTAHPGEKLIGRAKYHKPETVQWDEQNYRGDAYATYSWAAYLADVEIDLRTCAVRVTDFVALQEIGRALNPVLACGQIAGGVVQAIGWALYENVVLKDGVMINNQMTNYIIPGSGDLPPIRVYFEENPSPYGPGGAKGIGELPMDGPAPAIINAVCEALGISLNAIPLTSERLMENLEGRLM